MKKFLLAPMAIAVACSTFAQNSTDYSSLITPQALREKLTVIAGPQMEGRESGTRGQRLAAAYIQSKFESFGLLPGTPGGYQMVFPVYQDTLMDNAFLVKGKRYHLNTDYSFSVGSMLSHFTRAKEIVFVGYGKKDSVSNDLEGLDLKGKWVMMMEPEQSADKTPTARFRAMRAAAATMTNLYKMGATGVLMVSKDFPRKQPMPVVGSKRKKSSPDYISYTISPGMAADILGRSDAGFETLAAVKKQAYTTSVESYVYKRRVSYPSTNVLGVLPGTDKADEYVFVTAHYDHLGVQDGVLYPGADDDGSGTTGVLQMAEAFSKAKAAGHGPRRTIVFMTVSGEELGLLGSDFYTSHPVFPLEKTSADLNIDMVGRIDPSYKGDSLNYVFVIGDDRLSSELRTITDSANQWVKMEIDRRFNGSDPQRYYFRSDHYNFAKKGVPIIFYFNGTHADYHRPSDTVDKINFDEMSRRVQLVFHTAWNIANREHQLKRDLQLKE